jgi:hypothetical protein
VLSALLELQPDQFENAADWSLFMYSNLSKDELAVEIYGTCTFERKDAGGFFDVSIFLNHTGAEVA